jgi:uncharacterized protein YndB with AHSA1/START domain
MSEEQNYTVVDGRAVMTVFEIYIKATPERVWEAITDPALRSRYSFGSSVDSDWSEGSEYKASAGGGAVEISSGVNEVVDPPRRLVQTFTALWSDAVKAEGETRVTWDLTPVGGSTQLRVTHEGLGENANSELWGGWPMILSGLKTLLETGEDLDTPGSLRYSGAS